MSQDTERLTVIDVSIMRSCMVSRSGVLIMLTTMMNGFLVCALIHVEARSRARIRHFRVFVVVRIEADVAIRSLRHRDRVQRVIGTLR